LCRFNENVITGVLCVIRHVCYCNVIKYLPEWDKLKNFIITHCWFCRIMTPTTCKTSRKLYCEGWITTTTGKLTEKSWQWYSLHWQSTTRRTTLQLKKNNCSKIQTFHRLQKKIIIISNRAQYCVIPWRDSYAFVVILILLLTKLKYVCCFKF